ncbi:UNVERIFIED_CONTAM: hypothetical protein Sradi_6227200 [Sesamum radiatum]|uniref:Uncharacterized protein n=1 Tax=Sesamum radiatum TaxID=300843 RepID=A0AAW2KAT3_SESRA
MGAESGWNVDIVRAEFCAVDAECILGIRLQEGERDSLIWHFKRKGYFSVRSANRVALRLRGEAECFDST